MHGAGGKMNECAGQRGRRLGTDAEIDLSLDDEEGLVPRMTVRWRAAALGPALEEGV